MKTKIEALRDSVLVRRFNNGDEDAFKKIVDRHQAKIMSTAERVLRNRADAEEVTQDTFIRAHRSISRFRGDSSLATWLHRIAVNLSYNRYWYFVRRGRNVTWSLDHEVGNGNDGRYSELVSDQSPDPARESSRREFEGIVAECISKLEDQHREVLLLRNSLNKSYKEISAALGVNVGTVKSRISRARECLRALIAERKPDFGSDAGLGDYFEPARGTGLFVTS